MIVCPLSRTTPREGVPRPAIDPQDRRLARSVRAEEGQHLAFAHLEVHAEEDLDVAVGEVDIAYLEHRGSERVVESTLVLIELLLELGCGEGQIGPDRRRASDDEQSPKDGRRHEQDDHRRAHAELVGEEGRGQRAAGRTDEEDVDGGKGDTDPAAGGRERST